VGAPGPHDPGRETTRRNNSLMTKVVGSFASCASGMIRPRLVKVSGSPTKNKASTPSLSVSKAGASVSKFSALRAGTQARAPAATAR
jgi:hypothetical protein